MIIYTSATAVHTVATRIADRIMADHIEVVDIALVDIVEDTAGVGIDLVGTEVGTVLVGIEVVSSWAGRSLNHCTLRLPPLLQPLQRLLHRIHCHLC